MIVVFSMLTSIPYALSYVGEILKFTAGATHEANVINESKLGMGLPPMEIDVF
ncbi:hypothetical protein DPMN_045273 [Dreissena polymorpha]|uniref:Uncharacterized protein n=1 Tax=Dreissena polymorpha TaxID=45954 RepID=A0A9D4D626_DREPO|nr:hypothetical protein DPMN_045273 [Dreissena polymorpha]